MRPTDLLCLACEFRAAMKQSGMTTVCKFQYLQKIAASHYSFCTFDVQVFFCRCSAPRGMRPADLLCLACEFRVAINEQFDMTTARKFQYLQFFASCHYPFHAFDL